MKLNRKGFTLIELLAVVIILGLVLIIVFPNSIDVFQNAKLKSEKAFLDRLSQSIDSYTSLNTGNVNFELYREDAKKSGYTSDIIVYKGTIKIEDIINDNIITESDYINPSNKNKCEKTADIEIYKDSDSVYCHKVKKESLGCLTENYKNSIEDEYAIDTCIWTEE